MKLEIDNLHNQKGLTTKEAFIIIPLGKKGDIHTYNLNNGNSIQIDYGATINDTDRRNVITCISLVLNRIGYDQMGLTRQEPLPLLHENGQVMYTTFKMNASKISQLLYGYSGEGRTVAKSLKKASHVQTSINDVSNVFNQIHNVVYKDGAIVFDVANAVVNYMAKTILPFRIKKCLLHKNFDFRLSYYIETNQLKIKGKWYPRPTYKLDDIIVGLSLSGVYRNERTRVDKIAESFKNISRKDKDFPLYVYDEDRKWFYSKHKKGSEKALFEDNEIGEILVKKEEGRRLK